MEDRIAKLMADWSAWVAAAVFIYGVLAAWRASRGLSAEERAEANRLRAAGRPLGIRIGILIAVLALAGLAVSLYLLSLGGDEERAGEQLFGFWVGLALAGVVAALEAWISRIGAARATVLPASALPLAAALAVLPIHRISDGYLKTPLELSLAVVLGAALGAVLVRVAGLAYSRGESVRSGLSEGLGVETYVGVLAGLAAAEALGRFRFPKGPAALDFPYGVMAAALLAGLIGAWLAGPRRRTALPVLASILLVGAGGYLLATRVLRQPGAFYSLGIGLVSAAIIWGTMATQASRATPEREPAGVEAAVLVAVMMAGAMVLPYRVMGGYGIGLAALGMLSLLPTILCLQARDRWEAGGTDAVQVPARAVTLGAGLVLATALLRVLIESHGIRSTITLDALYPLVGLILGGSLPMVLRAITIRAGIGQAPGSAVFAAVKVAFWAAATPLLAALFFGSTAIGGFVAGMIAGELFALLALFLLGVQVSEGLGNLALILWMTVSALRLGPLVGNWSMALERGEKIHFVMWIAGAAVVWIVIVSLIQGRARKAPVVR